MNIDVSENYYSMSEFLESSPPNNFVKVQGVKDSYFLEQPIIQLHCDECDGIRNFKSKNNYSLHD